MMQLAKIQTMHRHQKIGHTYEIPSGGQACQRVRYTCQPAPWDLLIVVIKWPVVLGEGERSFFCVASKCAHHIVL
jgi:hypothetical protein